jgi:hypothetical protein
MSIGLIVFQGAARAASMTRPHKEQDQALAVLK